MALEVAVRAGLPLVGIVVAAVVGAAVLGPRAVDAALELLGVERVARDHRLAPVGLVSPSDDVHVRAGLPVDGADVGQLEPAIVVLHELTPAARRFAARAVGIPRDHGHDRLPTRERDLKDWPRW